MNSEKTNFRWVIVVMLFLSTTIIYFDRVLIGILAPNLGKEFGWNEQEYGYIVFSFQLTYAVGTFLMGYLIDRLGTRWGFALAALLWGLASTSHAFARSWMGFAVARMGLGIGQAANFPASIKTVAEWFPAKERAFATGLFNGGSNMGQVLAPLLIPVILMLFFSWKFVFVFSGILSALWLILWLTVYRIPEKSRFVNQKELNYVREGSGNSEKVKVPWAKLILYKQTWVVALGKLFADPVWYFYLFWGAKFLHSRFGINLSGLALPLVIIYLMGYIGGISGGGLSSYLLKMGKSVNFARKITLLSSAILVLPVMTVPFIDSLYGCVALIALAAAAHNSWSANIFTVASDLFPKSVVGSVIGFATTISSVGAMGTSLLIGYALNKAGAEGYVFPFVIASFGYLIGIFIVHRLSPTLRPVTLKSKIQ
jgi:ACS family hexuronate transporter-like MFS transporter